MNKHRMSKRIPHNDHDYEVLEFWTTSNAGDVNANHLVFGTPYELSLLITKRPVTMPIA